MIFIGIDPGKKGAIAFIKSREVTAYDMPLMPNEEIDGIEIREIIAVEDMKNYIISMISNTRVTVINKNNTINRDFKIKLVGLIKNIKKIVMLKFKMKKLYCKKRYNEKWDLIRPPVIRFVKKDEDYGE